MPEVFLVGGVRTPLARYGGSLSEVRPDDLAALVIREVIRRTGLDDDWIDEVILGAANQSGEDNRNVARMAILLAGLPDSVPGYTVNRLCASGLTAVASAAQAVRSGEMDLVIAGGVESMTRSPWVIAKPGTPWAKPGEVSDTSLGWRFVNPNFLASDLLQPVKEGMRQRMITLSMGETAEEVALLDRITRDESDLFALRSHKRALAAIDAGRFERDVVAVRTSEGDFIQDELPRRNTTLERLAALRSVFRVGGIVTAGTSSPLADGAAAVIVASEEAVEKYGLNPRARVVMSASAGVSPDVMGLGPVPATQSALSKAHWTIENIDAVELNEAFAVQSLAVVRRLNLDEEIVNRDGGAIALGHPLGCSGARILITLLGRLEREGGRRGLATLCVGVGQGVSMLVEKV